MQIINGVIIINNEITGTSPSTKFTGFTDTSNNSYQIDNKIIVRLYELLKFNHKRVSKQPWEEYTDNLFKEWELN
jgi:hypothetical protein